MNEKNFGDEIKALRKKSTIGSRELSRLLAKAETYISQLERGLIKKADYTTAVRLLKLLKVDEGEIGQVLNSYGIVDPIKEQILLRREIKKRHIQNELQQNDIQQNEELSTWIDEKKNEVKSINKRNYQIFNILIDSDINRTEKILYGIGKLLQDEKNYNFLFNLFQFDFSKLDVNNQQKLIQSIENTISDKGEM